MSNGSMPIADASRYAVDRRAAALATIAACERSGHLSDAEVDYLRQDRADAVARSTMALERVAARYAARVQFRQRKKETHREQLPTRSE